MMKKISYYLLYGYVYCLSLLPFRLLYLLSDGFYLLVYHVFRYRRKVVRKNLTASFPDKSAEELRKIERQFYHWFCDYVFEAFKMLSMSHEKMLRHIEFCNTDAIQDCFDKGQNCAAILGHYCNWEWLTATKLPLQRHPDSVVGIIYHPLYNAAFDKLFIDIRSSQGATCVPKQDILRHIVECKRNKKNYLFGYVSDQSPRMHNIHLWLNFLHQETPVFTAGERIMKKMDDAVFYVDMERPCRGKYICTYRLLSAHAAQEDENAITIRFFQMLEETIHRQPAYYLWTHNRWKRTRADFDREYIMVNGRAILRKDIDE